MRFSTGTRPRRQQFGIETLESRQLLATVKWDGGAGTSNWLDSQNWNNDQLPGIADQVSFDTNPTVVLESGSIIVGSMHGRVNLQLRGGATLETANDLGLQGSLEVRGIGTRFTANITGSINGATISALGGGIVSLPGVSQYLQPTGSFSTFLAEGQGSRIDFPALTTVEGAVSGPTGITFRTNSGGIIGLPRLSRAFIENHSAASTISFESNGSGSLIELPDLSSFSDASSRVSDFSRLSVRQGGQIDVPRLTALVNTEVIIDGSQSIMQIENLERILSGRIEVTGASNVRSFAALTDASSTTLLAGAAAVLRTPVLTQFSNERAFGSVTWQATGVGSVLDLSRITSLNTPSLDLMYVNVTAASGGQIDLSQLTTVSVPTGQTRSGVRFEATGTGSRIELDLLGQFNDGSNLDNGDSLLSARSGGTIDAPRLTTLSNTTLRIEGAGSILPTSQYTSITQGLIRVSGVGMNPDFSNLTQIESSSLEVANGGLLHLPQISSYRNSRSVVGAVQFKSEGSGSQLVLPALTSLTSNNTDLTTTKLSAIAGGSILIENLTSASVSGSRPVRDGICFEAHDTNSRIVMPDLVAFTDGSAFDGTYSCLSVSGGGAIEMPPLNSLANVAIIISGKSSQLPVDRLEMLVGGEITISGADNVRRFEFLNRIDGASLKATSGGYLSLPLVSTFDTMNAAVSWTQSGQGSLIHMPRLSGVEINGGQFKVEMPDFTLDRLKVDGNLLGSANLDVREEFEWSDGGIAGTGALRLLEGVEGQITFGTKYLTRPIIALGLLQIRDAELEIRATITEVGSIEILERGVLSLEGTVTIEKGGQGSGQVITNRGRLRRSADGLAVLQVPLENHGTLELLSGRLDLQEGNLNVSAGDSLLMESPSQLTVRGSFSLGVQQHEAIRPWGHIDLNDSSVRTMEVFHQSQGAGDPWNSQPHAIGRLTVASGTLNLEDQIDNAPGSDPEAIVVDTLVVAGGATLNLNGLSLYARTTSITGTVLGGTISQYPEGISLLLNQPVSGTIDIVGQVDQWNFLGRRGDRVQFVLDTGSSQLGIPMQPSLTRAALELVDPNGQVIGSTSSATNGATVVLGPTVLTTDGQYRLRVKAASSQPNSVGNYLLTVQDASVLEQPLILNQMARGVLSSPAVVHRWNFASAANQLVEFRLEGLSQPGIQFKLIGPSGFVSIDDLTETVGPFTLTAAGDYAIEVRALSGTRGDYSMAVKTNDVADLSIGVDFNGQVTGSLFSHVFRLDHGSTEAFRVAADLLGANSAVEIYARRGQAPTTQIFDISNLQQGSANDLLIAESARGEWYLLFVARATTSHPFRLRADHVTILVNKVTPRSAASNSATTLTIEGVGYLPGTSVELVNSNGQSFVASQISLDSLTRITAQFSQGLPEGVYRLRARTAAGLVSELNDAVEFIENGRSEFFVHLDSPASLGRHVTANLYVEYGNRGSLPMVAPVLVLQSADADGSDRPLFTLDANLVVAGFWATPGVIPEGMSHEILIYASGATPGLLQPGESVRIPVFYIGLLTPYDFNDSAIEFEVRVHSPGNQGTVDWQTAFADWRPELVSEQAWQIIVANGAENIGASQDNYVDMLARNASYLDRLGIRVKDASELTGFELQQAAGMDSDRTLVQSLDLTADGVGIQPSVDRVWTNSLAQRHELGLFGYGWTSGLQRRLRLLSNGTIGIGTGLGDMRYFQPDTRRAGAFTSVNGEFGQLTRLSDGSYELREADGWLVKFNSAGQWIRLADSHGNALTISHNAGLLSRLDHSSGSWLQLSYNAQQLVERIESSNGLSSIYRYDGGRRLRTVETLSGITTYTYEENPLSRSLNAIRSVTLPSSKQSEFQYNAQGLLALIAIGNGLEITQLTYDDAGRLTITRGIDQAVQVYFDQFANPRRIESSAGGYYNLERDTAGRLVSRIDSLGQLEEFSYSPQGLLAQYTDAQGVVHAYQSSDNKAQIDASLDARGNRTQYGYSPEGRLSSVEHADGTEEQFVFDSKGLLQSATNRRGQSLGYQSDDQGRLVQRTRADGSIERIEYSALGQIVAFSDARGRTSFQYNTQGRLTRVDEPNGRWVSYQYDGLGRRSRTEDFSGFVLQYRFDSIGRLSELLDGSNNRIVAYSYNSAGELAREDRGNGSSSLYQYTSTGTVRLIEHIDGNGQVYERIEYQYDTLDNVLSQSSRLGSWSYQYDSSGQLLAANFDSSSTAIPDQSLLYAYDAMGNRLHSSVNGQMTSYGFNELNQYLSVGNSVRRYDLDGNLVAVDNALPSSYQYDDVGRLTVVEHGLDRTEYEYDFFGNRTAIISNGVRRELLIDWSMNGVVLGEFDSHGTRVKSFAFGHGVQAVQNGGSGGQWNYLDFDSQGNSVSITDASGIRQAEYLMGPYGESIYQSSSVPNDLRFGGRYGATQEMTGLTYMRARYYDAITGRFLSMDPKGLASGDTNLYRYVGNRPTRYVDPFGTDSLGIAAKAYDLFSMASDASSTYDAGGGILSWTEPVNDVFTGNPTYHDPQAPARNLLDGLLALTDPTPSLPGSPSLIRDADKLKPYLPSMQRPSLTPKGAHVITNMQGNVEWLPTIKSFVGAAITAASNDPNDKQSVGVGDGHFVRANSIIPYRVRFENLGPGSDPTPLQPATAPAQRVEIEDDLSDLLDWSTVRFTGYGYGDVFFAIQHDGDRFFGRNSMQFNGDRFDVEVELSVDRQSGRVRGVFQSIDPDTQLPPAVLSGFLPPEDGTGRGQGFLSFEAKPKSGLATGTEIRNVARIVFDNQQVIATNQIDPHDPLAGVDEQREALVTIDGEAPFSQVVRLPDVSRPVFQVAWTGSDGFGSGILAYDIYVSIDSGPAELWLAQTTHTSREYTGLSGHSYAFYSVATDALGQAEAFPTNADSATTVADRPWHNIANPLDVNASGQVTAFDALLIINELNARGPRQLSVPDSSISPPPYLDTNGDGFLSAIDALLVINRLNLQPNGEGEFEPKWVDAAFADWDFDAPISQPRSLRRLGTRVAR